MYPLAHTQRQEGKLAQLPHFALHMGQREEASATPQLGLLAQVARWRARQDRAPRLSHCVSGLRALRATSQGGLLFPESRQQGAGVTTFLPTSTLHRELLTGTRKGQDTDATLGCRPPSAQSTGLWGSIHGGAEGAPAPGLS